MREGKSPNKLRGGGSSTSWTLRVLGFVIISGLGMGFCVRRLRVAWLRVVRFEPSAV